MDPDISQGARELVDLSAENVAALGIHLKQIGDIVGKSHQPPIKGERGAAKKMQEKLRLYDLYMEEMAKRKATVEAKIVEDFEALREWRKQAGTEGMSLVEQLEKMYDKVREQKKLIEEEQERVADEKGKVQDLLKLVDKKDEKWRDLAAGFIAKEDKRKNDAMLRGGLSSWLQCAFDNVRFRFKAQQEKEKLMIEHHRRMRKARAQARLDVVHREQETRCLRRVFLALQEETVECRAQRLLDEMRRRYEDHVLVLQAQVAQATGDEEKAKAMIAEQVRRLEEAKAQARESERLRKIALKEAREAKAECEKMRKQRDDALAAQEQAESERDEARAAEAAARKAEEEERARAEACDQARIKAEKGQRDAEDLARKKQKKIVSLQRMLAELGAESDSDAPPDERPPAFFVNEDGSRVPRPRTRKERMGMAYREAESARWELRIGMAAMIDKDQDRAMAIDTLKTALDVSQREVNEVRWANSVLSKDNEEVAMAAADGTAKDALLSQAGAHGPLPETPLAPSSSAVTMFSPARPTFSPAPSPKVGASSPELPDSSPRLLMKAASQPIIMPPLYGDGVMQSPASEKPLAPLRKLKRPQRHWSVGWH